MTSNEIRRTIVIKAIAIRCTSNLIFPLANGIRLETIESMESRSSKFPRISNVLPSKAMFAKRKDRQRRFSKAPKRQSNKSHGSEVIR